MPNLIRSQPSWLLAMHNFWTDDKQFMKTMHLYWNRLDVRKELGLEKDWELSIPFHLSLPFIRSFYTKTDLSTNTGVCAIWFKRCHTGCFRKFQQALENIEHRVALFPIVKIDGGECSEILNVSSKDGNLVHSWGLWKGILTATTSRI